MIKKLLIILLVMLAGLLLAGWYLNQQNQQKVNPQPVIPQAQLPTAEVTVTSQGFNPQTILIKKGSTVNWTNRDNKPHQIASDPHPVHTLLSTMGEGKLLPTGSAYTLTFDQAGTFTYHDEQNPLKFTGTVVVK